MPKGMPGDYPPKAAAKNLDEDHTGVAPEDVALDAGGESAGQAEADLWEREELPGGSSVKRWRRRGSGSESSAARASETREEEAPVDVEELSALSEGLGTRIAAISDGVNRAWNEGALGMDIYDSAELTAYNEYDFETTAKEVRAAWNRFDAERTEANKRQIALAIQDAAYALQGFSATATALITAIETSRAHAGADDHPADATPKEGRRELRAKVQEMETLMSSKEGHDVAETRYFDALEAHNRNKGTASLMKEQFFGEGSTKELKELRTRWIESRAAFAAAQENAAFARINAAPSSARDALLMRLREKHGVGSEKADLLARYERMVTVRTVLKGAEEAELERKARGLAERDKGALGKAFDAYKKLPPSVRILGTSALILGATAAGAAALGGAPIGLAALGLAGTSALLRWGAEVQKNSWAKASLGGFSRILSVGGIAGFASEAVVRGTHHILRTEDKAAGTLAKDTGLGFLSDPKNLERLSQKRKGALTVRDTIERQGRWARMAGSALGGFFLGHALQGHAAAGGETHQEHPDALPEKTPPSGGAQEQHAPAADHAEATPALHATPTAPEGMLREVRIDAREGFGTLLKDLRQSGFNGSTPVGNHLLTADLSPERFSHELGAYDPDTGKSMIMQPGDTLRVDAQENVWLIRDGKPPHLLLENDPSEPRGFAVHPLDNPEIHVPDAVAHEAGADPDAGAANEPVQADAPASQEAASSETAGASEQGTGEPLARQEPAAPAQAPAGPEPSQAEDAVKLPRVSGERVAPAGSGSGVIPIERFNADLAAQDAARAAAELFTNQHSIEIDPSTPTAYEMRIPGTDDTHMVMSGGTHEEYSAAAQQYARTHPGSLILFTTPVRDPLTGLVTNRIDAWGSEQSAEPELMRGIVPDLEGPAYRLSIDPQNFTRKLS